MSCDRTVLVSVSATGHVTVDCSGIEMGQGLNTMVCQAVVLGLNKLFPAAADTTSLLTLADVSTNGIKSTAQFPMASGGCNEPFTHIPATVCIASACLLVQSVPQYLNPALPPGTSGSGTTESCCDAAMKACAKIVTRLGPHRSVQGWMATVRAATSKGVDLTGVEGTHLSGGSYFIYAAGCTVVELDGGLDGCCRCCPVCPLIMAV